MKIKKKTVAVLCFVLSVALLVACVGCQSESPVNADTEKHIIGVAVYSSTDPEMNLFLDYYRNYIAEGFPVEFISSESLSSTEDEIAFIRQAKESGAEGIISFYGLDIEKIVAACEEEEVYYVLGSASISDTDFDSVKDNPWFLGVIGPDSEEEFLAGRDMAASFARQGAKSFLILSCGAAGAGNFMHYSRVEGMLTALQDELGLTYDREIAQLAASEELTEVETGVPDVKIVISPGYLRREDGMNNLSTAFAEGDYDALLGAAAVNDVVGDIKAEIASGQKTLLVGTVDCFSEENYLSVGYKDSSGISLLNYVKGKYASMVAPAFIAMYNAIEGDMDVVKPNGEAFRIYQSYWTASDEEEYVELYGYTQSVFENAYSNFDIMRAIKAYNDEASFEQFKALAEACDIESVRARLGA